MNISQQLFDRAKKVIPGGVNSPVRAFTQVGGTPRFINKGEGPYIFDVDGKKYIDYIGSWGPMILGHASNIQKDALLEYIPNGSSFGAPTELEVQFAEVLTGLIPGLEMIRLVSSGTEAAMSAVRLARAYTGKKKIIKFNGCYHGHADSFLVQAGSGVATQGISGSLGVTEEVVGNTISIEYNDIELLKKVVSTIGEDNIACICIEPVAGNMGLVLPKENYLKEIRELCDNTNILLLFDEVMTGFRVSLLGASGYYNIIPDIFCLGKVVGGGLPLAAFGGSEKVMSMLAPLGPVYQAGTLSGNPLAVISGLRTVEYLIKNNPYNELEERTKYLVNGLINSASNAGIALTGSAIGSMFGFFFSEKIPENYTEVKNSNTDLFKVFFHKMLERGVYFAPSAFEAGFLGIQHTYEVLNTTIMHADEVFKELTIAKNLS